jgi:hypothetical protein
VSAVLARRDESLATRSSTRFAATTTSAGWSTSGISSCASDTPASLVAVQRANREDLRRFGI